jgi:hypothetical protein
MPSRPEGSGQTPESSLPDAVKRLHLLWGFVRFSIARTGLNEHGKLHVIVVELTLPLRQVWKTP